MNTSNGVYDEIVDKIGTSQAQLILLENLKKGGEPEKMIKACLKALEFFPDDTSIRKILAETYFEQGSFQLAEIELEKLSKQIDDIASIYKLKAELYRKDDRVEDATHSLKIYLAHHSNDQDAAQLLSELSIFFEKDASILPTSTLAEIYYKQGEVEEAIKIYKQVVKDSPDNEKYKNRLDELMAIMETEEPEKSHEQILKEKKLRLIGILERWLTNIKQRRVVNFSHQG
ncbi:MAG: tetratricopeptide repeat protein [Thermodesulfobacteriota bacterium]